MPVSACCAYMKNLYQVVSSFTEHTFILNVTFRPSSYIIIYVSKDFRYDLNDSFLHHTLHVI